MSHGENIIIIVLQKPQGFETVILSIQRVLNLNAGDRANKTCGCRDYRGIEPGPSRFWDIAST